MNEIMSRSERFRKLIEIHENEDVDNMAKLDIYEMKNITGLNKKSISDLILNDDISMINKDNYAQIFDMLHVFAFDNFATILYLLNKNRKIVYNTEKLDLNITLKSIFEETCICNKSKCKDVSDAISRYHPQCMKLFLERGLLDICSHKNFTKHDSKIDYCVDEFTKESPSEKFYLSFEWLLKNSYLDENMAEPGCHEIKIFKNILLEHTFRRDAKATKLLFDYGAKPLLCQCDYVVECCSLEIIKLFVENGLPVDNVLRIGSSRTEDEIIEIVEYLISRGASTSDILRNALKFQYIKLIRRLIELGEKPISLFACEISYDVFVDLLNMGFQPHEYNFERAVEKKDLRTCMLLLDYGVEVNLYSSNLAFDLNLKDICTRIYQEVDDDEIKINLAIRLGDNGYAINYLNKIQNDKVWYKNIILEYGDDELKEYFNTSTKDIDYGKNIFHV